MREVKVQACQQVQFGMQEEYLRSKVVAADCKEKIGELQEAGMTPPSLDGRNKRGGWDRLHYIKDRRNLSFSI